MEAIGRLASGIAHEVNTPMQFIGDNIQFMSEVLPELSRLLEYYSEIANAAREEEQYSEFVVKARNTRRRSTSTSS